MKKFLSLTIFVFATVVGLSATPAAAQRFLADDQGLWHLEDNPALIASNAGTSDLLMGVSYDAMDASGSAIPAGSFGDVKAACVDGKGKVKRIPKEIAERLSSHQ